MRRLVWMLLIGVFMMGCAGSPPPHLGIQNGKFAPCPDKDNCVDSRSPDEKHYVEPMPYKGSRESALIKMRKVILSMERTRIMEDSERYLRVEFTSAVMGFVDDVEFYFPDEPVVHLKSASRIGYYDFGVNRKRIETIRQLFLAK